MKQPQSISEIIQNKSKEGAVACWTCKTRPFHLPGCNTFLNGDCNCFSVESDYKSNPCLKCKERPFHLSDCAVYNEPAFPKGECNCGAKFDIVFNSWIDYINILKAEPTIKAIKNNKY